MNPFKVLPIKKANPFKVPCMKPVEKPLDPEADPFKNAFTTYDDIPF